MDIRSYFASIDHELLLALLERRLKDRGLLALLARYRRDTPSPAGACPSAP